jgi:hypothetical protein
MLRFFSFALILSMFVGGFPSPTSPGGVSADLETYTYQLTQSTGDYRLWTAPPGERIFKDSAIPSASGAEVMVYAARNEFEPFQLVVRPAASGTVPVSIDAFAAGIGVEIYQVKYVNITQPSDSLGRSGPYPDPLWPLVNGATIGLAAGENTALWFSIFVPPGTASGDYTSQVHIGAISIPVRLHVFNFEIPEGLHVASQMNFSYQAILAKYGVPGTDSVYWFYVDKIKQYFIDHRLTPSSILWPGGLTGGGTFANPFIDYNCGTHSFLDPYGIWGFEDLAQRYINGDGLLQGTFLAPFNGVYGGFFQQQ